MLDPQTQAVYFELAAWIAQRKGKQRCPIFGINGAQGSGKSTASEFLKRTLDSAHGLHAVVVSLDDFYLPRATRRDLAFKVHPLFATRGVPGTHDVDLGISTLKSLRRLQTGEGLPLPRFSKADDDRLPAVRWPIIEGPVDLILFEGWCVGTPPQAPAELIRPVNDLEADEDPDGRWRGIVNEHLAMSYASWFSLLDAQMFLRVPDFDCVRRWRWRQEQDTAQMAGHSGVGVQSQAQLDRFIKHYERLTAHALRMLPEQADVLLELAEDHGVRDIRFRQT